MSDLTSRLPSFLVLGPPKAGTTTIYQLLKQHPKIFLSKLKEPRFFIYENKIIPKNDPVNRNTITNLNDYVALFKNVESKQLIGDISPGYFASAAAVSNIYRYIPKAKLLVSLRNPVDRAYSHFSFARMKGFESDLSIISAIEKEMQGKSSGLYQRNYVSHGNYYTNIQRYIETFGIDQIKVLWYDDLVHNPITVAHSITDFLEIDREDNYQTSIPRNKSGVPKIQWLQKLLGKSFPFRSSIKKTVPANLLLKTKKVIEERNIIKTKITNLERSFLNELYEEEILALSDLLGKNLDHWLHD